MQFNFWLQLHILVDLARWMQLALSTEFAPTIQLPYGSGRGSVQTLLRVYEGVAPMMRQLRSRRDHRRSQKENPIAGANASRELEGRMGVTPS